MIDVHRYQGPQAMFGARGRVAVVGEFGGLGYKEAGHAWAGDAWGYGGLFPTREALADRYDLLTKRLYHDRDTHGIGAGIYWVSSTEFPSFRGAVLEPVRLDLHAPTNWGWGWRLFILRGGLLVFPFRFGAATVLSGPFTPESMLETFARHRVTLSFCAPTSYRLMLGVPDMARRYALGSLRLGVSAAEPLPAATIAAQGRLAMTPMKHGAAPSEGQIVVRGLLGRSPALVSGAAAGAAQALAGRNAALKEALELFTHAAYGRTRLDDSVLDDAMQAAERGIATAGIQRSGHFIAAAPFPTWAARQGYIAMCAANVVPLMPAPGGRSKSLGTNPFCAALPDGAGGAALLLDMATSAIAFGRPHWCSLSCGPETITERPE